jgi:DNA (cytosine-5)-methyltransferase 1
MEIIKLFDIPKIVINDNERQRRVYSVDGLSPTILARTDQCKIMEGDHMGTIRIRKLTPTECYKLMGFSAEDCRKASEGGVSNSQLYKQAGNSIVVNVLEAIFTSLGEK